ncbi:hypothetical protein [Paraburkholderia sp. SOS3]|uniref:hypothetical protein n=1 Tax=Paraburkholderia sp. SOS3 TaxID=1926494 RepID=UPI00094763AF|nr:hypothetical protein [Paraburkholderia sp. SOS3]APR35711.1 hypothetical protein BTO02_10095 [Paraburkholderia sp. SOS3]
MDQLLQHASDGIVGTRIPKRKAPIVRWFFDEGPCTASYVVHDPVTPTAAVIDSVLDFDAPASRTSTRSAPAIVAQVESEGLTIEWLLATRAHADHPAAAPSLQAQVGGRIAIGRAIIAVPKIFGDISSAEPESACDESQPNHLFGDGGLFTIGTLECTVLNVPSPTPADMAYAMTTTCFAVTRSSCWTTEPREQILRAAMQVSSIVRLGGSSFCPTKHGSVSVTITRRRDAVANSPVMTVATGDNAAA